MIQTDSAVTLIVAIALSAYLLFVLRRCYRLGELASPLAIYAALVFVHFAIPGIWLFFDDSFFVYPPNLEYAAAALVFATLSFIFFHGGCLFASSFYLERRRIKSDEDGNRREWSDARLAIVVSVAIIIGWIARFQIIQGGGYFQISRQEFGNINEAVYGTLYTLEVLPRYVLLMVGIRIWKSPAPRNLSAWKLVFWSLISSEFAYWLPTGKKEYVILAILIPWTIYYLITRKFPSSGQIITVTLFVVLLFPATYYYRTAMDVAGLKHETNIFDVATASVSEAKSINETSITPVQVIIERLSLVESVAASIAIVESRFWDLKLGESYSMVFEGLIPRVLWEDKPNTMHYGTEFGHASRILNFSNDATSISVTYFGEAFLNFSWFGAIVAFFLGAFYGAIYEKAMSPNDREWIVIYGITIPVILYIGGTFAIYFAGLIKLIIIFYFLTLISITRERTLSFATKISH